MGLSKHRGVVLLGIALLLEATLSVQGFNLDATVTYDAQKSCTTSSTAPVLVTAVQSDACVESTMCVETPVGSALFPATVCSMSDGTRDSEFIKTTLPYLFGASPYVVVEAYQPGQSCNPTGLTTITTYSADGKCHKTGAATSYRATRKSDGSATVQPYSDAVCTTGKAGTLLTITAAQATGNKCDGTANGIVDTKVYGAGATPLYLTSTVNYDSDTTKCRSGLPSYVSMSVVAVDVCSATTACATSSAPYQGTSCSSTLIYKADMAATFGSNPYVILEKYNAGKSCNAAELSSITTYLADGKCHRTGAALSYRATRKADGSANVQQYTDAVCGTTGILFTVAAAQATGNTCDGTANGIVDTKVYGAGTTPVYLTSTVSYESIDACKSGLPSVVSTAVGTTCTESTACTGNSAPFTGTSCSTTLTYKDDMAVAFGSVPYLIVEKYTSGQSCNPEELTSITTYRADMNCHQMSMTASYTVTWSDSDLSAILEVFPDSPSCATTGTILALTRDMTVNNVCFDDIKVYGSWALKQYLSMAMVYDSRENGCNSPAVPTQLVTKMVDQNSCITSDSCIGEAAPYASTICTKPTSYQKNLGALFGSNPYVTVASYAVGTSCSDNFSTNRSYIADTKCHRSSSTTSFRAIRKTDGSATIMTYSSSASCSRGLKTFAVTADQASGNSCAKGPTGVVDKKLFGSGATPLFLTVTSSYDSIAYDCKAPAVPVQWVATTCSLHACVPSAGCRYAGYAPTSTVCSSTQTYQNDVAAAFKGFPFVTVERYIAGKSCSQSALSSVTTYEAGGNCHSSSSTTSFRAGVGADGSATVDIFPSSPSCDAMKYTLSIPAAQIRGKECVSTELADIKVSTVYDY